MNEVNLLSEESLSLPQSEPAPHAYLHNLALVGLDSQVLLARSLRHFEAGRGRQ